MPRSEPLTDTERAEILRRHAAGESRNSIAKTLGRSGHTVSKVVAAAGQSFARGPEVMAATQARQIDLAARRTAFAVTLQDVAEREVAKMTEPTKYWDWGGKDHDYDETVQPEPTASDRRAMMSTAATAVDRSMKLLPPTDDQGADAVGSLLTGLFDRLRDRHGGS